MQHYTLQLNARLRPIDRGEIYEDPMEELLEQAEIGSIDGGGTMMSKGGEVEFCDVEIALNDGVAVEQLLKIIEKICVPKGSVLRGADTEIAVGTLEGFALYINGTELADEVYETCDVNVVVEELSKAMEQCGAFFSHWQGPQDTALYFYGLSFKEMEQAAQPFLAQYPLCQKCKIMQIA